MKKLKKSKKNDITDENETENKEEDINNKEIEEKEKIIKEKAKSLLNEEKLDLLLKGTCKFSLEFGIKEGAKSVIVPKLITVLSNWFKSILKEKLLPKLLDRFDEYFEIFGERVIELQEKYNIKDYMDKILYSIEISFHGLTAIKAFIIPDLKKTIKKIKKDKENIDTHKIICKFNDNLIKISEEKILKPIKDFIDKIFGDKNSMQKYEFFEKIIEEGYKKVRKIGIEKYEEIKSNINEKYENYKKVYLDKKKEICNLPNYLFDEYQKKKKEYIQKYNEKKKEIIESTDKIIKDLKKKNIKREFEKIMRKIKNFIVQKLNAINKKAKDIIGKVSTIIPKFFDKLINVIDSVLNLNFGPFDEHKINICELLMNFLIEIESGNIELKHENENKEEIYEDGKKLLIDYLNKKLNLEEKNIKEIVEYLLKNGLKSILIGQINKVINYGQKEFDAIKKYYEPILLMIKDKFSTLKENISSVIDEYKGKVENKIDFLFEYIIKFLESKFKFIKVLDYYIQNITFSDNFQTDLLDYIKLIKNEGISVLTTKFEKEMQELDVKLDKELIQLKNKSNVKLRKIVNKTEQKVFKYINKSLKDIQEDKKEDKKKEVEEEEEEEEEEEKEEGNEAEKNSNKNLKNNENDSKEEKQNNKNKKGKKFSEFDIFDKSVHKIGKKINDNFCKKAKELEKKFIDYTKKSDVRKYFQKKYTENIDKKKFDDFFNSIELKKEEEKNYINSKLTKEKCKKLDKYVNKFVYSEYTENIINFIDKFDMKKAKAILDGTKDFSKLLDSKKKEEFRQNAKVLISEKLNSLYETQLEPKLKNLVINLCKSLIDYIDKKMNKKKEKKKSNENI